MAVSRGAALLVALSSAVLLAGCGESDPGADSGSAGPAPTPTPTADAAVEWADGVCSASSDLQESVRSAGGALQIDASGSATSLDQARTQAQDRVEAVQQSAAALRTALSDVPAGADPEVVAAQQKLRTASERAQDAVDQLGVAAGEVADAGTAVELTTSLGALKAAVTGTANDLAIYLESLRGTVDGSTQALRDSFGAAPACTALAG